MNSSQSPEENGDIEYALVVLKPDTTIRDLQLTVLGQMDRALDKEIGGAHEYASKVIDRLTPEQLRQHYAHIVDEPFYPQVEEFMRSYAVQAVIYKGRSGMIDVLREKLGATDPREAAEGTLRAIYGKVTPDENIHNVAHVSDSPEAALHEIRFFFTEDEIKEKMPELHKKLYGNGNAK